MHIPHSVHLSVSGTLGLLPLLCIVNNAAIRIGPTFNSFEYLGMELLSHMVILHLTFKGTTKLFSIGFPLVYKLYDQIVK